jgi:regulator of cell morphogenesis and NO signaling
MNITKNHLIGLVVRENYKYAEIFNRHGIDFCCNGNRSIEDACIKANLSTDLVISELNDVPQGNSSEPNVSSWPLDLLVDYIVKTHHRYVETKIAEIKPYLAKIVQVHGKQHPELVEIQQLFLASEGELAQHMKKEELILFPFISKMVQAKLSGQTLTPPHFQTVENPIAMMHHEHNTEGERFRRIAELTNKYSPPADACNTYRVTFALLQEFEADLHRHIHLENNVLFPEALALQDEVMKP